MVRTLVVLAAVAAAAGLLLVLAPESPEVSDAPSAPAPARPGGDAASAGAPATPGLDGGSCGSGGGVRTGTRAAGGRVVDENGRGVAGVAVTPYASPSLEAHALGSAETDADGRFPIRPEWGGQWLLATKPGESTSEWLELTADREAVELVLGPGATVEGRVLDRDTGAPVPGAKVVLRLGSDTFSASWLTESNPAGEWRFRGIPAGTFVLPWVRSSDRAWAVADEMANRNVVRTDAVREGRARVLAAGEVFRRDLRAVDRSGGTLRVRFELPEEVRNVEWVVLEHETVEGGRTWTELFREKPGDGVMEVVRHLPRGTNTIRIRAGRYAGSTEEIVVTGPGDLGERTVVLSPTIRVVAQLVTPDGQPLRRSGVLVEVSGENRGAGIGTGLGCAGTDEKGRAILDPTLPGDDVLAGDGYSLRITLRGKGIFEASPWGDRANFVIAGPELLRRRADARDDLVLPIPVTESIPVEIRVVDAAGAAVPGVRLRLSEGDFTESEAVSGPDGRVTLHAGFDPDYWSRARVEAEPPWSGVLVDDRRVLVVQRARTVHVRVLDDLGNPVAGASFPRGFVDVPSAERQIPETGPDGRVDVVGPASGFDLTARLPRDRYLCPRVEVPAGASEIVYRAYRLHPLRVRVIAPEELAAERELRVRCRIELGERATTSYGAVVRTGERELAGEILVPNLPVRFEVISPDLLWGARAESRPGDEEVVLTLQRRRLHRVVVELVDREGKPLAGLKITPDRGFGDEAVNRFLPDEFRADAAGRIVLELPEGTWRLPTLRSAAGHWLGFGRVEVPADEPYRFEMHGP